MSKPTRCPLVLQDCRQGFWIGNQQVSSKVKMVIKNLSVGQREEDVVVIAVPAESAPVLDGIGGRQAEASQNVRGPGRRRNHRRGTPDCNPERTLVPAATHRRALFVVSQKHHVGGPCRPELAIRDGLFW